MGGTISQGGRFRLRPLSPPGGKPWIIDNAQIVISSRQASCLSVIKMIFTIKETIMFA